MTSSTEGLSPSILRKEVTAFMKKLTVNSMMMMSMCMCRMCMFRRVQNGLLTYETV